MNWCNTICLIWFVPWLDQYPLWGTFLSLMLFTVSGTACWFTIQKACWLKNNQIFQRSDICNDTKNVYFFKWLSSQRFKTIKLCVATYSYIICYVPWDTNNYSIQMPHLISNLWQSQTTGSATHGRKHTHIV